MTTLAISGWQWGGSVGIGRRVNRVGKEKVGGGRNKNSSRTRGCWRWRKDKRLTVSNTRGCWRWRKDKRLIDERIEKRCLEGGD